MSYPCKKCGSNDFGIWTSTSTGKVNHYCRSCRRQRATTYEKHVEANGGKHTDKEWREKVALFDSCPHCKRSWKDIPHRPNRRYKTVITKGHLVPNSKGGRNSIDNLIPICYRCNFSEGNRTAKT